MDTARSSPRRRFQLIFYLTRKSFLAGAGPVSAALQGNQTCHDDLVDQGRGLRKHRDDNGLADRRSTPKPYQLTNTMLATMLASDLSAGRQILMTSTVNIRGNFAQLNDVISPRRIDRANQRAQRPRRETPGAVIDAGLTNNLQTGQPMSPPKRERLRPIPPGPNRVACQSASPENRRRPAPWGRGAGHGDKRHRARYPGRHAPSRPRPGSMPANRGRR